MTFVVITGTGTDVGKTVAAAAVAAALSKGGRDVVYAKPIQTGEPEGSGDAATVARLSGVPAQDFLRFPEPLAPNLSARRAGVAETDLAAVEQWLRGLDAPGRIVLVEGAGGLLVRLAEHWTLVDLARRLDAPLLVVTSLGLGSLNAAELTVRAAEGQGLQVLGLIGGALSATPTLAAQLNVEELENVTGVPLLGVLEEGAGQLPRAEFRRRATEWLAALPELF